MKFKIITELNRIVISKSSLNKGVSARELFEKLSKFTGYVSFDHELEEITVRFNDNDLNNYPEGFEKEILKTIKENVYMLPLKTEGMMFDIEFDERM